MKIRALLVAGLLMATAGSVAPLALGANSLPLSNEWNIAPTGSATSAGSLHFRVTPGTENPVDITVPIMAGATDVAIARYIQRALGSQLRSDGIEVATGAGTNVMLKSTRKDGFSVELVDSSVENVRVAIQSTEGAVPPTVPKQSTPANPPINTPATPPAPGDAVPPDTPTSEDAPGIPPKLTAVARLPTPRFRARFP